MCNKSNLLAVTNATLYGYNLPFHRPMQFKHHQLRGRDGLILQLTKNNGVSRFVDIAPLPGFSHEQIEDVIEPLMTLLTTSLDKLENCKSNYPSLQFALASLLINECEDEGHVKLDKVPLLQGNKKQVEQQYQHLHLPSLIKLKVARAPVAEDIAIFQSLCQLNPNLKIRCDANQAWDKQNAAHFFSGINIKQLDYIEEPTICHHLNLQLAEQYSISLGLDETLQDPDFDYQPNQYVGAFIIKPTIIGDKNKIDKLVSMAMQQGISINFSSSFESVVGIQQLKNLARHYARFYTNNSRSTISLGIDTLKYFDSELLINKNQIFDDCQKLEVLWTSN